MMLRLYVMQENASDNVLIKRMQDSLVIPQQANKDFLSDVDQSYLGLDERINPVEVRNLGIFYNYMKKR